MAWKPKTIFGKVLKGAAIGIGGAVAIATGVGAIAGVVGGAGLLAGAASGVGTVVKVAKGIGAGTKTVLSKVSAGAVKLVTGQSKEERALIKDVKAEAREAKGKVDLINKLVKTGLSQSEAENRVGQLSGEPVEESLISKLLPKSKQDELLTEAKKPENKQMLIYAGLGLAALFVLPKLLKR